MTSHIRIPDITPVAQDVADGNRRTFEFPFPIFEAADLDVLVGDATVTAGFVVRGAGSSDGGAVVFATAPAAGLRVTLRRRQTYARTGDLPDERGPTPRELNDAIDQGVAAVQELDERLSRTVRRSPAADLSQAVDLTLPEPEAGRVLGWNGSADGLVNLAQVDTDDMLRKSRNLADLPDKAQARTNLGLGNAALRDADEFATAAQGVKADSALQSSAIGTAIEAHSANLDWVSANLTNAGKALLDDADATAQRTTLGLAAVAASGSYTDLSNTPALGSAAAHNADEFATAAQGAKADSALQSSVVDTDVTLSANSDGRIASQKAVKAYVDGKSSALDADVLHKSQNLADLPDKAQARTNLGLGNAALRDAGEFATAAQGAKADGALQASAIGTAVEAHSANLDWVSTNLTAAGKTLLDDTDASAQRATLGLAAVAASGSYTDLSNTPPLGSAAVHNAGDFATAAQGAKADSALQSSVVDTDTTLSANSDSRVASQKAVKSYVDTHLSSVGSNLHLEVFASSGNFVTPAGTTPATSYEFTLTGGGGGSGGMYGVGTGGTGGGGAGATAVWLVSGLAAGTVCSVVVGAGGAAGAQNGAGGNGGNSSVTAGGTTVTAGGGSGSAGVANSPSASSVGGAGGTASGGTLKIPGAAGLDGSAIMSSSGHGGASYWGAGGKASGTVGGGAGAWAYGSGAGGQSANYQGFIGASGIVLVRWIG